MAGLCTRASVSPGATPAPPEHDLLTTPLASVVVPEAVGPSDGDRDCGLGACQANERGAGSFACRGVSERLGEEIVMCGVLQTPGCKVPVARPGVATAFCACANANVCSLATGKGEGAADVTEKWDRIEAFRLAAIAVTGAVLDEKPARELTLEDATLAVDAAEVDEIRYTLLLSQGIPSSLQVVSEPQVTLQRWLLPPMLDELLSSSVMVRRLSRLQKLSASSPSPASVVTLWPAVSGPTLPWMPACFAIRSRTAVCSPNFSLSSSPGRQAGVFSM